MSSEKDLDGKSELKVPEKFIHLLTPRILEKENLNPILREKMDWILRFKNRLGLYVFPFIPFGKRPKVEAWNTRDDAVPVDFFDNYGIRCGDKSREGWNLIVLDFESLEESIRMLGIDLFEKIMKETLCIRSAHLGLHVYFFCDSVPEKPIRPAVSKKGLALMDLLSINSAVVGPGSVIDHSKCESSKCPWKGREVFTTYEQISAHRKIAKIRKETLGKIFKRIESNGYQLSQELVRWLGEKDSSSKFESCEIPKKESSEVKNSEVSKKANSLNKGLKKLHESEIVEIKEILKPAYRRGYRQLIWLFLSGWAAKAGIDLISVAKILKMLYEETGDEDDLRIRSSALIYSYGKSGINVEQSAEALEKVLGCRPYGLERGFREEEVKGISGLQEILLFALNEESSAIDAVNRISEIFSSYSPYRDPVFVMINAESGLFLANMQNRISFFRVYKKNNGRREWIETRVIIAAGIREVSFIKNIATGEMYWKATWEMKRGGGFEVFGTVDDHIAVLKNYGLIRSRRDAEDAIQTIFDAMLEKGIGIERETLEVEGFYVNEKGMLECSRKIDLSDEELKAGLSRALKMLREISNYFNSNTFGVALKWAFVAPIAYALKKLGKEHPRRLVIVGPPGTGKTSLAILCSAIWDLELSRFFNPCENISTPARLGKILSQWTYPTLVDNASQLFVDANYSAIRDHLNTAEETDIARKVHVRGKYTQIPALSPLIFTIDTAAAEYFRVQEKRRSIIVYTSLEKWSPERAREFNGKFGERAMNSREKLCYIGFWLSKYYIEKWESIRDKNWIEIAEEALNALFEYVGEQKPEWIEERPVEKESVLREIYEEQRMRVIEIIHRYVADIIVKYGKKEELGIRSTLWNRLDYITENNLPSAIYVSDDKIIITREFLKVLKEENVGVTSLKDLAQLMGWEYRKTTIRGLGINSVVVIVDRNGICSETEFNEI